MTRLDRSFFGILSADEALARRMRRVSAFRKLDDVWSRAEKKMDHNPLSDLRVVLAGFDPVELATLRATLRRLGVRASAAFEGIDQLRDIVGVGAAFNTVMINLEAFQGLEQAIDALIEFREKSPGMAVVLVSSFVGQDDYGAERKAIADVTLRRPVSPERLKEALLTGLGRAVSDHLARSR